MTLYERAQKIRYRTVRQRRQNAISKEFVFEGAFLDDAEEVPSEYHSCKSIAPADEEEYRLKEITEVEAGVKTSRGVDDVFLPITTQHISSLIKTPREMFAVLHVFRPIT